MVPIIIAVIGGALAGGTAGSLFSGRKARKDLKEQALTIRSSDLVEVREGQYALRENVKFHHVVVDGTAFQIPGLKALEEKKKPALVGGAHSVLPEGGKGDERVVALTPPSRGPAEEVKNLLSQLSPKECKAILAKYSS